MTLGDRIRERIDANGTTQRALAEAIGMTPAAVSKIVKGGTRESPKVYQIARFLRTTPEYLIGEADDPDDGAQPAPTSDAVAQHLDAVMIGEVDLAFGLGGAFIDVVGQPTVTQVPFPRRWLRQFAGNSGEMISVAPGQGDSMEPTIKTGDLCLFDRSQQRIDRQDGLWALAVGEILMFKRVRANLDGSYAVLSDNPAVPPERMVDGEMHVIGRVVAVIARK